MAAWLRASVLALFGIAGLAASGLAPVAAAAPARAAAEIECPSCAGTGQSVQRCWVCRGEGEHDCPTCRRFARRPPSRVLKLWMPGHLMLEMNGLPKDFELPKLELPEFPAFGSKKFKKSKPAPKPVKLKDGEVKCPASCRSGRLSLDGDWVDCRLCRGGKFRCEHCKKGRVACRPCDGEGEAADACDDCAGRGKLEDPASLSVEVCPWCTGSGSRACGTCDTAGQVQLPCASCWGSEVVSCSKCRGVGKRACSKCGARGRFGRKKENCEPCSRRGVMPCYGCEEGVKDCRCTSAAVKKADCPDCEGRQSHPCNGCAHGGSMAWEFTARQRLSAGAPEEARGWLEEAQRRCERRYDAYLQFIEKEADASKRKRFHVALKKDRKAEREHLAKLEREIEAASTP